MKEYTIKFEIPSDVLTQLKRDTGIILDPASSLSFYYDPESPSEYNLLSINNKFIIYNKAITLVNGYITEDSLDI